jgi:lipopolysaccharide/colanic/teichoic acid biosynthesis glycosyltransferase
VNIDHKNLGTRTQSTIAVDTVLQYGAADSLVVARPRRERAVDRIRLAKKFKFFVGEVFGLLFITATTLYIFVVPVSLAGRGNIEAAINRVMKRAIDIVGATVGLILTLPLLAVISVLVKLTSPGPVFYTQVRVGVNRRRLDRRYCQHTGVADIRRRERRRVDLYGKLFRMVKFRTMVDNAERETGPVWATQHDGRVTRFGRFLRVTRMDELPQFWSILVGDMSLVGPRPERPAFVRDLCCRIDDYQQRLDVKPGLTGLAQIENGYDSSVASVAEKVKFDLQYIRGWSLWADVRILLKTVIVVVTGKGAC